MVDAANGPGDRVRRTNETRVESEWRHARSQTAPSEAHPATAGRQPPSLFQHGNKGEVSAKRSPVEPLPNIHTAPRLILNPPLTNTYLSIYNKERY